MRIGRLAQTLAVLLLVTVALVFTYVQGVGYGVIQGRVIIGPWTPVEPPGGSHPPPEIYTSRRIILEAPLLPRVEIPMNGTGYFITELPAGTYTLTLSNCTFLGCPTALPRTVVVNQGQTTTIEIDIDTGIR